ncbi:MAG: hypothetical protein AAFX04_09530 [Pseudomonadota bacterium]
MAEKEKSADGFKFNQPTIVALLYLGSFLTGVSGLVGVVLAFVWRGEGGSGWETSHYTFHIYTFVIGLVASLIAFVLLFVFIGALLYPLIAIWVIVRTVVAMLAAQKEEPIKNPKTMFL